MASLSRSGLLRAAALALALFAACFPQFDFSGQKKSSSSSSSTTSSSSSSAGGAAGGFGGATGTAGHGGATGGGGASSGQGGGGGGGGPCALGQIGACGENQKCTVVKPGTGEVGCTLAGQRPAWSVCLDDEECADGTWCDLVLGVCKPVCKSGNDCAAGAQCYQATTAQFKPIKDLKVCTAHCNPMDAASCNNDWGATNCFYLNATLGFDCGATQNKAAGSPCTLSDECAMGLVCAGGKCWKWCAPTGQDSGCGFCCDCCGLDPKIMYNNVEHGICSCCWC
ncbi:MAG: hypothetical protein HY744_31105 [Deltaproteobacteria bacterium]|nr:hypothetical protein [Deltaproteobacteria bacterium]